MQVKHLLLIAILAMTAACSSTKEVVDENLSEVELYQLAQKDLDNNSYTSATAKLKALESRYPFGLFRAWTIWRPAGNLWVYPKPESPMPAWPVSIATQADHPQQLAVGGGTEFDGVRAYRRGDTLRQVVWKKAARTGELISRETAGAVQRELVLQWQQAQGLDTEARLSRLAAWVVAADAAGHRWGLALPNAELAPDNGAPHRHAALRALASL